MVLSGWLLLYSYQGGNFVDSLRDNLWVVL
jgi:hypothetical protein